MPRFPHYGVPLLCVLILSLAWVLRPGREDALAPEAPPVLTVWCAEAMRLPLAGIAEAFQRRYGIRVELRFVADAETMVSGGGGAGAPDVMVDQHAKGSLIDEHDANAQAFLRFLEGPLAVAVFDRYRRE